MGPHSRAHGGGGGGGGGLFKGSRHAGAGGASRLLLQHTDHRQRRGRQRRGRQRRQRCPFASAPDSRPCAPDGSDVARRGRPPDDAAAGVLPRRAVTAAAGARAHHGHRPPVARKARRQGRHPAAPRRARSPTSPLSVSSKLPRIPALSLSFFGFLNFVRNVRREKQERNPTSTVRGAGELVTLRVTPYLVSLIPYSPPPSASAMGTACIAVQFFPRRSPFFMMVAWSFFPTDFWGL